MKKEKKKRKPRKVGQPEKYEKEVKPLLEKTGSDGKNMIERLATYGLTDEQLATALNISRTTLDKYKKKYQEFDEILKRGKIEADKKGFDSFYKRVIGFEFEETQEERRFLYNKNGTPQKDKSGKHKTKLISRKVTKKFNPPDVIAGIFFLKNRLGWQDKPEFNLFDDINIKVTLT